MKKCLIAVLLLGLRVSYGYAQEAISTIDFVKIKNNHRDEALFYYENNWKAFHDIALEKGYIKSYQLQRTQPDTSAYTFDFILITEYSDSAQYKQNEPRFQEIIKSIRPNGPKMFNDIKPNDFREIVFFKFTETLFIGRNQRGNDIDIVQY